MGVVLVSKVVIVFVVVLAMTVKLVTWHPVASFHKRWKGRLIGVLISTETLLLLCILMTILVNNRRLPGSSLVRNREASMDLTSDEAEVQRVVQECQRHERLGINVHPQVSYAYRFGEFWLPSSMGGRSITGVRSRLQNLINHGWHHGEEARMKQFEFRYARVKGEVAEVGTQEAWYLPVYDRKNQRVADINPNDGPYLADYTLQKVGRKWLLATDAIARKP